MSKTDFTDPATLAFLAASLEAAGVAAIEIGQGDNHIRVVVDKFAASPARHFAKQPVATQPPKSSATMPLAIKAPMAGHFQARHPSRAAAAAGDISTVSPGDIVAFIRAGAILVPVRSTVHGTLKGCLVEDGALVGFGTSLFEIELQS